MTSVLKDAGVDLLALSIADTTNFGILRAIVSDNDKAVAALREAGYTVNLNDVLAVVVEDTPGGLADILNLLYDNNISVEYLYSFVRTHRENALILFKVDDNESAAAILQANGVALLSKEQIIER